MGYSSQTGNSNNKRVEGGANTCGWWSAQMPSISTTMPPGAPTNAQRPVVSGAGLARRINRAGQKFTGAYTNAQIRSNFADTIPGALPYNRSVGYAQGLAAQQQAKRVPTQHVENAPLVPLSQHCVFWGAVILVVFLTHQ